MQNAPQLTIAQLQRLASGISLLSGMALMVEAVEVGGALVRIPFNEKLLRPGGTIAGPVLMTLADFTMYGAVLSLIGLQYSATATAHLGIDFLRRPPPQDVIASAKVLKLGRRLAMGTVVIRSGTDSAIVAHASCTYALPSAPPKRD